MTGFRLAAGGRIDRSARLRFTFDGVPYSGFAGDTLASALLANGVRLVGRSFKYHRPRGVLSAGSEEPNALVTVERGGGRTDPNSRATMQELHDGLAAVSQNRWPSLRLDFGAAADLLHPLIPAGFYYKTFMWPAGFWASLYEPAIRRAAGLGRAPDAADPDLYSARYAHCEVLVVGAGAAGLAAALAASEAGARVILCDENAEPGGGLLDDPSAELEGTTAAAWRTSALAALAARDNVTLLPRTTAIGAYHSNLVVLLERVADHLPAPPEGTPRQRLWRVRAREMVLASGATERPLVFAGNDRPGIMLAGSAPAYLHRYGVAVGGTALVATADDAAWRAAFALADAGAAVAAIADLRPAPDAALRDAAGQRGIPVIAGAAVEGTRGRRGIAEVAIRAGGATRRIACDVLLTSGGWTPNVHLFSHGRGSLAWQAELGAFVPDASGERVHPAGAANGTVGLAAALAEGFAAGRAAAAGSAPARRAAPKPETKPETKPAIPAPPAAGRAFVDLQNDVTAKDIALAVREGYRSPEHVKRYTTAGMATDQGRTGNLNVLAVAAAALGRPVAELGVTTYRPPYTPTTFGALAGHARGAFFAPVRQTPTHDWAVRHGAVFEPVGLWRRARYYPRPGEDMDAAVARECRAVRSAVGLCDASTLGKIAVDGPDAAAFLDRIYINGFTRLAPGRCRYGVILGEDGYVLDDGVVVRLAADSFHVTTTSGGVDRVLAHMEDYRQTEWPELRVWLTPMTEQWAVIGVNGPRARDLIAPLVEGIDVSAAALPHMAVAEGTLAGGAAAGVPLRLCRVSFTGELGYELNVPAAAGAALWERLLAAGERLGATPYGTEAMHVLRAEKGYIIPGQDTDGTVTPDDAGLGGMIGKGKPDFVGKRSLSLPALAAPGRRQLVGLLTEDPSVMLEEGSQLVADPRQPVPATTLGHVTSSYRSAALGRSIALALVADGRARLGARLHVPVPGAVHAVTLVSPVFYDPEGTRLHG